MKGVQAVVSHDVPASRRGKVARRMARAFGLAIGALALAGCEPIGPFAGGALSGPEAPAPAAWDAVPDTVQLEVRPADPYSVNIWAAGVGPALYVAGDPEGKNWISYIREDANVRVRLDETVYSLAATEVDDAEERAAVVAAYVAKYEEDPADGLSFVADGAVFRLQPRP